VASRICSILILGSVTLSPARRNSTFSLGMGSSHSGTICGIMTAFV
jgi:hypothetical protein